MLVTKLAVADTSRPSTFSGTLGVLSLAVDLTNRVFDPSREDEDFNFTENLTLPLVLGLKFEKLLVLLEFHMIVRVELSKKPPFVSRVDRSNISPSNFTLKFISLKVVVEVFL